MENKVGRPTIMTDLTVKKLEEAYANDATDEQACFLANISKETLYTYQDKHPEFVDRKKALKAMVSYQAKMNIKEVIFNGDEKEKIETSKWLLPKKEKRDYSERTEHTGKDGKDLPIPILTIKQDVHSDNSNKEDTSITEKN